MPLAPRHKPIDEEASELLLESPLGLTRSRSLSTRRYRVPPFFVNLRTGRSSDAPVDDPFADGAGLPEEWVIPFDPRSCLRSFGIGFPEGASATYDRDAFELTVRNTESEHAKLAVLLRSLFEEGMPKEIKAGVWMISGTHTETVPTGPPSPQERRLIESLSGADEVDFGRIRVLPTVVASEGM